MILGRLYAGLIFLLVLGAAPGLPSAQPTHRSYDDIVASGVIRVAVYENFAPFSYRDGDVMKGVDIDLARHIAGRLGVEAEFIELPADETVADDLRNAIWKGHYINRRIADLMMHVPYDRAFARKNDQVVIFGPYYDDTLIVARDLEKTGETPTLAVYRYEKIGVELDSLPDFFLTGFQNGILSSNVVHYATVAEACAALVRGEIAAVFSTRALIENGLGKDRGKFELGAVFAPGLVSDRWTLGMAVSSRTRQLGYAIDDIVTALRTEGAIGRIFADHDLTYTAVKQE